MGAAPAATGAKLGVAAGGGAVVAWQAPDGVQVARRAAGGDGRWIRTAPPPSAARLIDLAVTRLGDAAVMAAGPGDALVVARRPVGSPRWLPAPIPGGPAADGLLRADAAGDLVAAWASPAGVVRAASYAAPALPAISQLTASPAAFGFSGATTLRFRLSAAGRVVVSLRRPFGARALAAFTVAGRRGANAVRVPRSATARLLGPGRYVVVAETSARRLGEATTVVRRTP